MKKILSTALSVALVGTVQVSAPTAAVAQDAGDTVEFCRTIVAQGFAPTIGECVGSIRSNAQQVCKDIEPIWDLLGIDNVGDCVSLFRGRSM